MDARALHRELDSCMRCDQHRLRNRLKRISKLAADTKHSNKDRSSNRKQPVGKSKNSEPDALEKIAKEIKASAARKSARLAGLPAVSYTHLTLPTTPYV